MGVQGKTQSRPVGQYMYAWLCNLEVPEEIDTGLPQCEVQDNLCIFFNAKTPLEQPRSAFSPVNYPCKSGFGFFSLFISCSTLYILIIGIFSCQFE